jgi:drug/metabolite transporter (DMT)-like permease
MAATFIRLVLSSAMILSISAIAKKLQKVKRKDYKWFLLIAFFEPFLYFIGETNGMFYVSSTLGAVVIATIPLFCPLGELLLYKAKISASLYIGIIISVIGVCVIAMDNSILEGNSMKGIYFLCLAIFAGTGHSLLIRKVSRNYNALSIVAYQNTIGIFLFMPIFFIFEYDTFITVVPTREVVEALIYLSIFASSLAFILYTYSLNHLGISKAVVFCNTIPVFTAIFAYFIVGEEITPIKILGIGIVVSGLFLSQIKYKKIKALCQLK